MCGSTISHRRRFIQLNFVSPGIGGVRCFTWIGRSSAETPLAPAAGWMANCPCLPIKLCGSGRTNQPLGGLFRRHYLEAGEKAYRNDKTERPRKPCKHKASRVLLMVRVFITTLPQTRMKSRFFGNGQTHFTNLHIMIKALV